MANKKNYYKLDETGILGSQKKRTKTQISKEINDTVEYIKEKKSGKFVFTPGKSTGRLSKVK